MARVLVACEYSGIVREAFRARGHDAWSCDLLPTEQPSAYHLQCDVLDVLQHFRPTLLIGHPPCRFLAVSGARWNANNPSRQAEQALALGFVSALMNADAPMVAIENPVSVISTRIRKPDQIVQPWMFGHGETKATCLWLRGLPLLIPTNMVEGRESRVHRMAPSPERWKDRSRTYTGVAAAMAEQWGAFL
jgi:hypothetical protein